MSPGSEVAETTLREPTAQPLVFDNAGQSPMARAILEAMSDATSRAILNSIVPAGKSVEDITAENGVPISTTYRRVHELCQSGLIMVERVVITNGGKRHSVYRSTFRGASIDIDFERMKVIGLPNEGIPDIMFRLWQFAENQRQPR